MGTNAQRRPRRRETIIAGPSRDVPFGELVRQAWATTGLTQQEFADRLGVSQPRVPEIFASESITERLLDRCVAALGAELEVRILERGKQ